MPDGGRCSPPGVARDRRRPAKASHPPAAGCDTVGRGRAGHQFLAPRTAARVFGRWLLLTLVLAGIFGMHGLTAEDGVSGHGVLPVIGTAGPDGAMTGHDPTALTDPAMTAPEQPAGAQMGAEATFTPAGLGSGMALGAMAGCILFLVTGAAALILALLRHRRMTRTTGLDGRAHAPLADRRRRGPPGRYRPRVALCVIRI